MQQLFKPAKRKTLKYLLSTASLAAGSPVLYSAPAFSAGKALMPVNFGLDWSLYGTHAAFFLGLKNGLYAKEGLDVKITEGSGSATLAQQIARGNQDLGFQDFATMIRGVEQKLPIIAVMRVLSGALCVISRADKPIKTPKELEGHTMAYSPAESSAQILPALLAKNGVDASKIEVIQPAATAKLALFLQGRVDAIPGNVNQQVAQAEEKGIKVHYFRFSDFGVNMLANGIVSNTEFAKKNPEAVRGFVRATRAAFEQAAKNPEAAVDALLSYYPQQADTRSTLLRQWELSLPAFETPYTAGKPLGWMDERDWQETQDILLKYGGLPKATAMNLLYTNQYLPENGN
ncbi:ABC transporter substrate-binding protein [Castellaniella sp. GW247-6E4]|uniref:ABC transporter substrate-binding protein n=1 Tax=Castellaniella sp. GW247-6E4 TaxID=3140380 RepID=UPI003316004D